MTTFELSPLEISAVISAHEKQAENCDKQAREAREKAASRCILWQRWLKRAIVFERMARQHRDRAKEVAHRG